MPLGKYFRNFALCSFVLAGLGATVDTGQNPQQTSPQPDPWSVDQVLRPEQLSRVLSSADHSKPAIIYVGFPVLYRGAHISGAILAGPASKAEGLSELRKLIRDWARDRLTVLYCGCCPFQRCPNIRPAFRTLQAMGFSDVKVLRLDTNLHTDWTVKGYPVVKASSQ